MTAAEMRASIQADYPGIARKAADILKQWRKLVLRSNRTRRMVKVYSLSCAKSHQDYLFVCVWEPDVRRFDYFVLFAVVRDFAHTYYISCGEEDDTPMTAYTDHFFHRYAERTGMPPDTTIEQAIAAYYRGYTQPVLLYSDEDDAHMHRAVYAERQGIKLTEIDPERWFLYRTFVSLNMLKPTQRAAYRTVMDLIERSNDLRNLSDRYHGERGDFRKAYADENIALLNEASDIYAKYFES